MCSQCISYHCRALSNLVVLFRYFDSHGNYYFKDDPENVQDSWLQEVDWNKVDVPESFTKVNNYDLSPPLFTTLLG